jgi:hypothetical protein
MPLLKAGGNREEAADGQRDTRQEPLFGAGIAIGVVLGVAIGLVMDNLTAGIGIGLAIGIASSFEMKRRR